MPSPAESTRCSRCGAEKPASSPCPRCLLQLGLSLPPREPGAADPARSATPEPAELARHFPGLEILELVARGGMGAVYRARHRKLDRVVALKILAPELSGDPAFAVRFLREARAMARLDHPNIVAVHDFGESEGLCWLLMEYVDGPNLRQALAAGLTSAQALAIVPQLCDALQAAHDLGVVHRDIKPENVLLDRAGKVKIADFGLAKLVGAAAPEPVLTRSDAAMGTLHYMAPEQIEGARAVDHRADIFSLGVVFYEMLTGRLPLGSFEPPSRRVEVDVRLDEIVLRALAQEPERRYQRAVEVKTDVQALATAPARSAGAAASGAAPASSRATAGPTHAPAPASARSATPPKDSRRARALAVFNVLRPLLWPIAFLTAARVAWGFETVGLVLLAALYSMWLYLETRALAERDAALDAALRGESRLKRRLRFAGFVAVCGVALGVLGAAVESSWERGTDHYASPAAHVQRLEQPWSEERGYELLRLLAPEGVAAAGAPELGEPQIEYFHRRYPTSAATAVIGALLAVMGGCVLAHAGGRMSWRVAVAPLVGAALVFVVTYGRIQLHQADLPDRLEGLGGSERFSADLVRVREALLRGLERRGDGVVVAVDDTLVEKRARTPLAEHSLVATTPGSPFLRWRVSRTGPTRVNPGLVFELVGSPDGATTVLTWNAGLLREGDSLAREWRREIDELLQDVRRASEGS